jgi:hypothetical protein
MFARLARSGLAQLWPVQPRRVVPRPHLADRPTHSNDNLPGFRRPAAAGKRRAPTPVLACHWVNRDGRLECRWHAEPDDDAPIGGFEQHGARSRISATSLLRPYSGRLVLAG